MFSFNKIILNRQQLSRQRSIQNQIGLVWHQTKQFSTNVSNESGISKEVQDLKGKALIDYLDQRLKRIATSADFDEDFKYIHFRLANQQPNHKILSQTLLYFNNKQKNQTIINFDQNKDFLDEVLPNVPISALESQVINIQALQTYNDKSYLCLNDTERNLLQKQVNKLQRQTTIKKVVNSYGYQGITWMPFLGLVSQNFINVAFWQLLSMQMLAVGCNVYANYTTSNWEGLSFYRVQQIKVNLALTLMIMKQMEVDQVQCQNASNETIEENKEKVSEDQSMGQDSKSIDGNENSKKSSKDKSQQKQKTQSDSWWDDETQESKQ